MQNAMLTQDVMLTRAEELVVRGATYGLTLDQIANGLGLSRETVGREIAEVYIKVHSIAKKMEGKEKDTSFVLSGL